MEDIWFEKISHKHHKENTKMAPKITDPNTFLVNIVSRKGKSDLYGVYLTGVNILADAVENYGYCVSQESIEREVQNLLAREGADWNHLLVETRRNQEEIVHPISFIRGREPNTVYFIVEGHDMSAMVFIPTLVVPEFVTEVTFFQHLLREVASFAGKTPTSIRFTIGSVSMEWDELVERGCAREVDIGF
jgi:hypothetical protein